MHSYGHHIIMPLWDFEIKPKVYENCTQYGHSGGYLYNLTPNLSANSGIVKGVAFLYWKILLS